MIGGLISTFDKISFEISGSKDLSKLLCLSKDPNDRAKTSILAMTTEVAAYFIDILNEVGGKSISCKVSA
jgi:hypothetical protein